MVAENPSPVAAGATPIAGNTYEINQEINIYAMEDDPIDAARKFRDSMREAAEEW